jgi:class 3 adenylate cyclase
MKSLGLEAPPLERRLAAILAADVEAYSRLMHGDEEATLATLSARRAVIDELIMRHRGRIANTAGDSVLAEFASVLDAVHCAIEIQDAVAHANEGEPEGRQMRFRIGINVGDVMVKDGDLFGDGVNVAARLEGLVIGGEICVSRGVRDHLRHRRGIVFEDLGEQLVKNIAHPIRAFRLRIAVSSDEDLTHLEETGEARELGLARAPISEVAPESDAALELAFWESVKGGTAAELESYLERYPEGTFASLARTRLETRPTTSEASQESAAAGSELSPDTEAAVELAFWESVKDGTAVELETYLERYPDGVFAALARTRLEAGLATSETNSEPSSELSAETEARLELAFWESVKDGTTDELRSYLERYPDGTFAPLARTRLAAIEDSIELSGEASSGAEPDELDLAFWNSVKDSYRREELQAYLDHHPNGHFATLARARLALPEVG